MAPLSLKIIQDGGAVTRTVLFDTTMRVGDALALVREKVLTAEDGKDYGLFLTSADNEQSGVWLESHRPLDYYMLRDGDSLYYLNRTRNLRVKMLDGSVKTLQVDESKNIGDLMLVICSKIGITNHDEYGLCQEEMEVPDEQSKDKEKQPGTLTLKRKPAPRERDSVMDQLSKKLKTDDNVEWLDQHRTLREIGVDVNETLLLKRKLFYSDRNVDCRDPVQLNLLYVQTRNAILDGRHPVTEEQAMEFAGIQCQIHFGDFQEEKHKPGLIENLSEYLPQQYAGARSAEKKILKLFRKHSGLSSLDAKYLYIKTARDLPTYGVTFFVVKEQQKNKKKLVPRLLGINSESILRLDEETKEILQAWPLTHIKSYQASKKDTFMLNFGDYSDKEYCVKTNEALRIRDILEGYIDLIRRRMAAPWDNAASDSGAMMQDTVQASRGNIIQHVANNPNKIVEHSYIGPSKILSYEPGSESSQGTQIMTVQQVVITSKGTTQQQAVTGEVPLRGDMSLKFVRKLNRMNSNSVKVVTLLTDPTPDNIQEAKKIVQSMEDVMPEIIQGVRETAEKQKNEEAKKQLLDQLEELMDLINALFIASKKDKFNPEEVQDPARKIADLTTQMYFAMDPRTRRRSELVRKSRQSFIADEKTDASLRRASFINASAAACAAIDDAEIILKDQSLPVVAGGKVDRLESAAVDKMAKLNAAIGLFLTAHSDRANIDYPAAVTSMNTIKELMPELATDVKALSSVRDGQSRSQLLTDMHAMCACARQVCQLTGTEDHGKIQEAANSYADISGQLLYAIDTRRRKLDPQLDNQIIDLAKEVGDMTTLLLVKATELTATAETDPQAGAVDDAGVVCADAARDLLVCAQLTAPTVYEPHCQSALTASAEHLLSSAQNLALAWKPLVEDPTREKYGEELTLRTMELAKALDRLKDAYRDLGAGDIVMEEVPLNPADSRRLRFITSVSTAQNAIKDAHHELNKPAPSVKLTDQQADQLQSKISGTMGQINAGVASLLQAKADSTNPDYDTAELAMTTISEQMPPVIKDIRTLSSTCGDEGARQALVEDVRAWCDGIDAVCHCAQRDDAQALDEAAKEFAKASKKLRFVFSPLANSARERLLMELFKSAHNQAIKLVDDTEKMADTMGGANGVKLKEKSGQVADSARALKTAMELTAPSIDNPRCQSALLSTTEHLALTTQELLSETASLQDDETGCRILDAKLHEQRDLIQQQAQMLQTALQGIRETFKDQVVVEETAETPAQKVQRLKFITSTSAVKNKMKAAEDILNQPEPMAVPKLTERQTKQLESKLGQSMVGINAALATLIQAKSDQKNPDYNVAQEALRVISDIMPQIVKDTRTLSSNCKDEKSKRAMIEDMQQWCEAIQGVCDSAAQGDTKEFVDSAQNFVDTSNKLTFIVSPAKRPAKEQQVLKLTSQACATAHAMAADGRRTANEMSATDGARVTVKSSALSDAAQAFNTTAQLTTPSIGNPRCQSALLSSTATLTATAEELVSEASSIQDPKGKALSGRLVMKKEELDAVIKGITESCGGAPVSAASKAQQLKFTTSAAAAKQKVKAVEQLLNKPFEGKVTDQQARQLQRQLSGNIANINGAVATLLFAKSNPQNPDYKAAEESIAVISDLLPAMVDDTRAVSTTCTDEQAREAMIADVRAWCTAIENVCVGASLDDPDQWNESVLNFANVSDKLSFVFPARRNPAKEQQILRLSASACDAARIMADESMKVAKSVGGADGDQLYRKSIMVTESAKALQTTAQLTAPSIQESRCHNALVSSADGLSTSAQALVSTATECKDPGCKILGEELGRRKAELDKALGGLKEACKEDSDSPSSKDRKVKFANAASDALNRLTVAEEMLNIPVTAATLDEQQTQALHSKVADSLSDVSGALAALINTHTDSQHPNYIVAEESMRTIADKIPVIVNDARTLSSTGKDMKARQTALEEMKQWCTALQDTCIVATKDNAKVLNEKVQKVTDATQKMSFVANPSKNRVKEKQIIQLSNSACDKARQMCEETERVSKLVGGGTCMKLDRLGADVAAHAQAFDTTAQLTAPSIDNIRCQRALLSSADALKSSAHNLVVETSRLEDPRCEGLGEELERYQETMSQALEGVREACKHSQRGAPPPIPQKKSVLSSERSNARPPPPRVVSHSDFRRASLDLIKSERDAYRPPLPVKKSTLTSNKSANSTTEVLNGDSTDSANKSILLAAAKKTEEEKRVRQQFTKSVEEADKVVCRAEEELNKVYSSQSSAPPLDQAQAAAVRKQLEEKLALAGAAAARLVACHHPDSVDYTSACESTKELSHLMPDIVKDASLLSGSKDERSRRLLDEIKALCAATRRLYAHADKDPKKLNEVAVSFGDSSARLLYSISSDIDPAQEKLVISRAKAIGDSASRLALGGATVAANAAAAPAQDICDAGKHCADAAGTLVYTAKLVAPSIHHQECQQSLISASFELSSQLQTFTTTWKPLEQDQQHSKTISELDKEAKQLEKLLEEFRQDLKAGKLVKKKDEVVIEDTGLRRLASTIMEDAKRRAESTKVPEAKRRNFASYANKLTEAISALDVANSRHKRAPQDVNQRQELENAVQTLQIVLLQSRPSLEDKPQNNIVDLTDFVKDVSTEAEKLTAAISKTTVTQGKKTLEDLKQECHNINLGAFRLMNPSENRETDGTTLDDILEVDQFGLDCSGRISDMNSKIQTIEDRAVKERLHEKMLSVEENCNMLRFATKSALSTAQGAALDVALEDLADLEKRLDTMVMPLEGSNASSYKPLGSPRAAQSRAQLLASLPRVCRGDARPLPPAFAAYVTDMRAHHNLTDTQERNRLKEHLSKLLRLLKTLTMTTSTRVALWQPVNSPETAAIMKQIVQELENPSTKISEESDGNKSTSHTYHKILNEEDMQRLLLPVEVNPDATIKGDIEEKVQRAASQLAMLSGTVLSSAAHAQSLGRSAHTVLDVAGQLTDTANVCAMNTRDPIKRKRIETSLEEMRFATYNLLKYSELYCQEQSNPAAKRRMMDACKHLGDALNKLTRATSPATKLHNECNELHRTLQIQQSTLQDSIPFCAAPYAQCVDAVHSQQEIFDKLKTEEKISRKEFTKALSYISAAACNSSQYAAQCSYLIAISKSHGDSAREGLVDVGRIEGLAGAVVGTCHVIMRAGDVEQVKEEESRLIKQVEDLKQVLKESATRAKGDVKREITEAGFRIDAAAKALQAAVDSGNADKITSSAMTLSETAAVLQAMPSRPGWVPAPGSLTDEVKTSCDDLMKNAKTLITKTQALVKEVKAHEDDDDGPMTWVTFNTHRTGVLDAFETLLNSIKHNGQRVGLLAAPKEEEIEDETPQKSYVQIQVEVAHKWLQRKPSKPDIQANGEKATNVIIDMAEKMAEDLKDIEKEELTQLISETKELYTQCSKKYDNDTASALMDRLRDLRKAIERGVVSRVVEDFIEAEQPLADLDIIADAERDEAKRKFILEKKIAELLSQLGRVTRTARLVAGAGGNQTLNNELNKCSQQTELLAPLLVKAAQERVSKPTDQSVVENYKKLLAQYAESLSAVRDLCDRAVDPMDFVQTAGETMSRMKEDTTKHNDPQQCAYTSNAITRLANRVISVSMSSPNARGDPELRKALAQAQQRLTAAVPAPDTRQSKLPDWRDTADVILRTTGEVESVLGGEHIFGKQPEPDQPIYNAALNLHAAVREWSGRDNEVVATAKRMAVLMARLSDFMNTDKKRDVLVTSKSIVQESHEVARLARKLALECDDVRIRTNLLQVCERIPTISGQLKMLTTVKGASFGSQGSEEDKEAMNMLVGNAQNLMISVQEVVKVAASATVKISASKRGPRMKWVRKNYY